MSCPPQGHPRTVQSAGGLLVKGHKEGHTIIHKTSSGTIPKVTMVKPQGMGEWGCGGGFQECITDTILDWEELYPLSRVGVKGGGCKLPKECNKH